LLQNEEFCQAVDGFGGLTLDLLQQARRKVFDLTWK
jgi:hypothetical protein